MIIPNLMVTDMPRSIAFYRDVLGMKLTLMVSSDKQVMSEGNGENAAFATLEWDGDQLMLQTVGSLSAELDVFDGGRKPSPSGTINFRDIHPDKVLDRVTKDQIVKGPFLQWYGMIEIYLRDPDGYIICVGAPEGAAPQ
ncbi:MAG: VOC family protein [Rhizobiaceae bacterium]|nr:VOC family protein [Rhizobiaceae bacterium]